MSRSGEWLAEYHEADQRRFLNFVAGSFVAHVVLVALAGFSPAPTRFAIPDIVRVDLVALPAPAAAGKPAARKPAPAPKKPPAPLPPKAAAPPPKPAAPPRIEPKQVVLPKQAPAAVPKKPVRKPEVKPEPAPVLERPEPIAYDDALSQLRAELGEEVPVEVEPAAEAIDATGETTDNATDATTSDPNGANLAAAQASAWERAVQNHLSGCWITPPEFLNRGFATGIEVNLTAAGVVIGAPRITRGSGDPFFDDNAQRAAMGCSPFPAPDAPGKRRFEFTGTR